METSLVDQSQTSPFSHALFPFLGKLSASTLKDQWRQQINKSVNMSHFPVEDTMIFFHSIPLLREYLALPLIVSNFLAPNCKFLHTVSTMLCLSPLDPSLVCKPLKYMSPTGNLGNPIPRFLNDKLESYFLVFTDKQWMQNWHWWVRLRCNDGNCYVQSLSRNFMFHCSLERM